MAKDKPTSKAEKPVAPKAGPPKKSDPKAAHVARSWKYISPLLSCRFDPSGRYLFAGAQDTTVQRWDLLEDKHATLSAHDSWVRGIAFSKDGKTVITGGCEGKLIWWPTAVEKPQPVRVVEAHDGWIRALAVSPDGKLLASVGNDLLIKLWNLADGSPVKSFAGHKSHIYSTMFHPDGSLLSGDLLGKVFHWDIATGKQKRTFDAAELHTENPGQAAQYGGVRSMSLSPDGVHLSCSGLYKATNPFGAVQAPRILLFDWKSQKKVQSHLSKGDIKAIAWRAIHHSDGYLLCGCGGGAGGYLLFFRSNEAPEFHKFKLPNTVWDMDLHRDELQVATVHYDKHIRITHLKAAPKKPAAKKPVAAKKKA